MAGLEPSASIVTMQVCGAEATSFAYQEIGGIR